jgi:hypothetical protein
MHSWQSEQPTVRRRRASGPQQHGIHGREFSTVWRAPIGDLVDTECRVAHNGRYTNHLDGRDIRRDLSGSVPVFAVHGRRRLECGAGVQLEEFIYMVSTRWHARAAGVGQEQRIYRGAVRRLARHRLLQCRRTDGDAERTAIGCRVPGAVQRADHVHRDGDRERRGGGIQVREVFGFDRVGGGPRLLREQRLFVVPAARDERGAGLGAGGRLDGPVSGLPLHGPLQRRRAGAEDQRGRGERHIPGGADSTITWTVLASGGAGPLEYKFHRFDEATGAWTVLRDWSQDNQASWTPGPAGVGVHWLQVWVRTVGSSATYDDWRSTDSFLVTPTEVSLTSNRALTGLHLNDVVTWTAAVDGAPGPWEFKFVAYDSTAWRVLQDYSPQTTFTWFPPASTCALQVWVRRIGSNAAWEQYQSTGLFVVSP